MGYYPLSFSDEMSGRGRRVGIHKRNQKGRKAEGRMRLKMCYCPRCGETVSHQRGIPCTEMFCPTCNSPMIRQGWKQNNAINQNQIYRSNNIESSYSEQVVIQQRNIPKVNIDKCKGCGKCLASCKYNAIKIVNGKAQIDRSLCRNCRACIDICPFGAIS